MHQFEVRLPIHVEFSPRPQVLTKFAVDEIAAYPGSRWNG